MLGDLSDSETQGRVANRAEEPSGPRISVLQEQIEAERPRWFDWVPVFVGLDTLICFMLPSELGAAVVTAALVAAVSQRVFDDRGTFVGVLTGIFLCGGFGGR